MRNQKYILPVLVIFAVSHSSARAFGFFNGTGLQGGSRWDSTPRTMQGVERSLNGGLRFSMQGGSYTAFRNLLTWQGTPPTAAAFEQAVLEAFAVWTRTDPATGLTTTLQFVPDLATATSTTVTSSVRMGCEIDIMVSTDGSTWNVGDSGTRAEAFFNSISVSGNLRLTSGTTNYAGFAISGADITFNSNTQAIYTLTSFRTILAHEIGHALGLADVDTTSGPAGQFVDDNYASANALGTLMNSFALKINHLNPGASPLAFYTVANGVPGLDTSGVNILMESNIPSVYFGAALGLANDDYAGRQFMYPVAAPAPPNLSIAYNGSQIILTWNDVPAWQLHSTENLSTGPWSVTSSQGVLSGGFRTLQLARNPSGKGFFRLQRNL